MRAVILKMYYMPNGVPSIIHNKIPPNFKGNWGRVEKNPIKNVFKNFKHGLKQIEKKLLPRSGETECYVCMIWAYIVMDYVSVN